MGKRTYIYHKETANGQTTLVTSNGGHPIPSNSEVVVEFPGSLSDTEIESRLKKISNGERGYHTMGLKRYVLIGGEKISVKIAQSYRENPSQSKPFSLQVQQWLEGKISQTGEKIMPTSSAPQPAYLAQPMDTIPPFTASTGPEQSQEINQQIDCQQTAEHLVPSTNQQTPCSEQPIELRQQEDDTECESETKVRPGQEEMTRFGAKATRLLELDIAEDPSKPMIINQQRNVRQKWFKDTVTRIVAKFQSAIAASKGEYVIDFNAMQEEIEKKVAGLSKALHKAKKKRAFPTTAADLDREDTRSAEEYSNDCKSLATQICQRALQELQKGPGADKILILFPRGEKGQPDGKIVQKKPIQDLWGKHHRRTV